MKRKYNKSFGFTMIEMLATILVLLVILLIATPSIRRMLNKTNELSKEYVENIIIDSAREYAIVNNKTITSGLKLVGDTSVISLTTLLNVGLIEQSDIDTLGPNARVLLTLKENNYVEYKIVYDGTLVENNASHIVLLGGNPLYVKQGTPYLEPGYISYDRDGKIITDKVLVTGTVNTSVIGNYVLTYKITDDLGNTEEVKRTVIVVDNTYPKVTVATTVSNNPYNNKFAKNGERITLNITFSKVVTDPKVTIGGREATLSGSGTTRTATLLIPSDESSLVSNKGLEIKISDYIDEYDNIGQIQTDVTSGGLVVFDNIAPTLTSTVIVSNNTSNKLAKNNETITMTQTFSEPVINPSVRISGRVMTSSGTNTNTITSTYLIPSTESTLTEGNLVGSIVQYMDRAGNIGDPSNIKLNGATVVYDRTAPTCVSSGGNATWRNTNLTITGTCTDTGSGCVSATITKVLAATTTTGSPGTVTDKAGNSTACPGNQVANIDKVAPTCVSSGGNATWRNTNLTITGTCTDTGGSGCTSATVTGTLSATTTTGSPGTVTDKAGNSTACPGNQPANIDKVAPTCAVAGGSTTWTGGSRLVTGTCSNTGGSGCVGNISHNYTTDINTTTAGAGGNSVGGTVSDKAGNTANCLANQTVRVDKTPPTCVSSGGSATWRNTDLTITGTCSDSGSGCSASTVTGTLTSTTTTGSPGTVTDKAGNSTACPGNQVANIDKVAPTCVSSGGNATWRNTNLTITGTCSDTGGSGCTSATVTGTLSATTTTGSPGTVTDKAGNSTACPGNQPANIDKVAPTCAVAGGSTTWTGGSRLVTGTCSDTGGSGCVGNISHNYTTNINTTTAGAGGNSVGGTVSDKAGNTTTCASNQTVRVDKTAPEVAESYSGGMLFRDANFSSGTNGFGVYNNSGGGTVTQNRIALSNPYGSYVMRITTNGVSSPGLGGYVQSVTSRANAIYIHKIIAKIPVGYTIQRAANKTGVGSSVYWITPQAGTGDWQEYIYIHKAGSTSTTDYPFSNFGHVYLTGPGTSVTWDVAYSTIIDTGKQDTTSNIVFKATDGGSGFTHYGINQSSTTQPTYTAVTNSSSLGVMKDKITTNGTYYIWVKDAVGNVSNKAVTVNTVDNTAPTVPTSVVRIGSSTGTVRANNSTAWSNQTLWWGSFSSTDAGSGVARYEYSTGCTGTVTGTLGGPYTYSNNAYNFCIRAVDNAGNESAWSTATYIRADTTAPPVPTSVVRIGSSTGTVRANTTAWSNKTLWWGSFSATDATSGIARYEYSTGCTGTLSGTLSTSHTYSNHSYDFCIRAVDNAGNISGWSTATYIRADTTFPTCVSSGGNATWRNTNLTITGTCSDAGSGCSSTTVTSALTATTTTGSPGTVTDKAGNSTTCPANQVANIDKVAPTCVSSGGNATWRNTNLTITGTCSDTGGSGCVGNVTKVLSATTTTGSPGTVTDKAGNSTACPANQVANIDKVAPTCVSSGGNATWRKTNLTITGTCSDTGGSGCSSTTVTSALTATTTTGSPGTVTDKAGNSTACPANQVANIDKVAPTCVSSGGNATWRKTNLTITGTCSDTGGSGCSSTTVTSALTATTTTGSPGTVTDKAGNSTTCPANQVANIDKTAPTCVSSGGNATWRNTNLTITGTCSDTGGSGCSASTVTGTLTATTTTGSPGTLTDKAGNSTTCPANQVANIDKVAPTCAVSGGDPAWTTASRVVTGTCSDTGGSGCVGNISYTYSTAINTTTAGAAGNNNGGTVNDKAGNSVTCAANQTVRISAYSYNCSTTYVKFCTPSGTPYVTTSFVECTSTTIYGFSYCGSSEGCLNPLTQVAYRSNTDYDDKCPALPKWYGSAADAVQGCYTDVINAVCAGRTPNYNFTPSTSPTSGYARKSCYKYP